jgi:L-ascorbate metabolism protein UlaG (beta-lactamase superfamily)
VTNLPLHMTYVGGPTALLEFGGVHLLTDPTFDAAGSEFRAGAYVLRKTQGPAIAPDSLGRIDAVLLSHDQHFDNLDASGRQLLSRVGRVLTTEAGAGRLGPPAEGLVPWQSVEIPVPDQRVLRVTATPARHGPAHLDRGPVIGFVLAYSDAPDDSVYVSGDTVWYEDLHEVSRRFSIRVAILFMGAARVAAVGPWHLTFTATEGVEAAHAFKNALIVPLHFEGWEHFSESRDQIQAAFREVGLESRLRWLERGHVIDL